MLIAEKKNYQTIYRSALFGAYNKAKAVAKNNHSLEIKRVHKAIGLAVSEVLIGKKRPYATTINECNCPDYHARKNGFICKHRIAKMIIKRANEKIAVERAPKSKLEIEAKSQEDHRIFMAKVRKEQDAEVRKMQREKSLPAFIHTF